VRILFDQGVPAPLRRYFSKPEVIVAAELGWSRLTNGQLLDAAEQEFNLLVTDQWLRYQQNLAGRKLSILILPSTSWPKLEPNHANIIAAAESIATGAYVELQLG